MWHDNDPPVLKITRPSQGSLRLLINEIFSSVTHKNTNLSINQFIYYIFIYYRYSGKVLDSPKNIFADLDRCKPSPRHSLWPYHQNIIICLNVGISMPSVLHLTLPKISDVHVFTFRNIKKIKKSRNILIANKNMRSTCNSLAIHVRCFTKYSFLSVLYTYILCKKLQVWSEHIKRSLYNFPF